MMAGTEDERGYDAIVENHYSDDWNRLLQTFPPEIWRMILNCLEEPKDLKCVDGASPVLGELLEPRKVDYLFPDVWTIVRRGLINEVVDYWSTPSAGLEDSEDEENDINSAVLKLRLVTRTWKATIDACFFIAALPAEFSRKSAHFAIGGSPAEMYRMGEKLFSETNLLEFLTHFESTHGNGQSEFSPIPNRQVYFSMSSMVDTPSYRNGMSQLLQAYGHHIWNCAFVLYADSGAHLWEYIECLREWLAFLPNLISLSVTCPCLGVAGRESDLNLEGRYPPLPKLEYLRLWNVVPAVGNLLVQSYRHVSILKLSPENQVPLIDVVSKPFPNLRDLVITFSSMSDFRKIKTSRFSRSFSHLEVRFDMESVPRLEPIVALLAAKWGTSLKSLKINIPALLRLTNARRERVQNRVERFNLYRFWFLEKIELEMSD